MLIAVALHAQPAADGLPAELLACAGEADAERRLACFDREVAKYKATPPAPPAPPPPPVADDRKAFEPVEFSAVVVDISHRPHGEMIILLDNEQVWQQKHTGTRFRLDVGDTATVKKSAFGGYRLFGEGNRSIQVERTK